MTHFPTVLRPSTVSSRDGQSATSNLLANPREKTSCSIEAYASAEGDLFAQTSSAHNAGAGHLKSCFGTGDKAVPGPSLPMNWHASYRTGPASYQSCPLPQALNWRCSLALKNGIVLHTVRTFEGNKATWTGKLRTAMGLLGL